MPITALQDLPGRACAVAGALEVVGDRGALLVVREVSLGSHGWVAEQPPVRRHHAPGDDPEHPVDTAWTCRTWREPVNGSPVRRVLRHADGTS